MKGSGDASLFQKCFPAASFEVLTYERVLPDSDPGLSFPEKTFILWR